MRSKDFIFELAPTMEAIATETDYYLVDIDFPYGDKEVFWNYMVRKYMERRILPRYLDKELDEDGEYSISKMPIHFDMKRLFAANQYKYRQLATTMNEYDMFSPYHIDEELVSGTKIAKTTDTLGGHTATNKESSMDNLNLNPASSTETTARTNTSESDNNKNETHSKLNKTVSDNATTTHNYNTRYGNIGNHIYADIIKKEREVAMFNLWDVIALDIADMLTFRII